MDETTNDWLPIETAEETAAEETAAQAEAAAAQTESGAAPAQAEAAAAAAQAEGSAPAQAESGAAPAQAEAQAAPAEETPPAARDPGDPAAPEAPAQTAADAEREAALSLARAETVLADWEREAAALREIYPAFDLQAELRAPGDFGRLLAAGLSVRQAFETAHFDDVLAAAVQDAALHAGRAAAESVLLQRERIRESPVSARAAVSAPPDVNSLTRGDILRILGEVSRGARITFK